MEMVLFFMADPGGTPQTQRFHQYTAAARIRLRAARRSNSFACRNAAWRTVLFDFERSRSSVGAMRSSYFGSIEKNVHVGIGLLRREHAVLQDRHRVIHAEQAVVEPHGLGRVAAAIGEVVDVLDGHPCRSLNTDRRAGRAIATIAAPQNRL
jgi:hypothetical protein